MFSPWVDRLFRLSGGLLLLAVAYFSAIIILATSPKTTSVGYQPTQPIPYSHAVHAGKLGIDCRYCHNTVEYTARASVPPTETCMNCHKSILPDSEKLTLLKESFATGKPIKWVRVHDLPDFVYFNHSAHVMRGVGCVTCHGRVDRMEVVYQAESLSMGWCLECHRNPEKYLRPKEFVTKMDYVPEEGQLALGERLRKDYDINPSTDCWTCHR